MKKYRLVDTFLADGFYLTQEYGTNKHVDYTKFGLLYHEGIDLGHKNKRVIARSPINGLIVKDLDIPRDNYGNHVVIWDDVQLCAVYICHLDANLVSIGQRVRAGDPIGEMGKTGNVTGEHLHFNFCVTNAAGKRLYNAKGSNLGFLDPLYPRDPSQAKYPPGVSKYAIEWLPVSSITEPMPEKPDEKKYTEAEMTQIKEERDHNLNEFKNAESAMLTYKAEAVARRNDFEGFTAQIAEKLTLPTTADRADIFAAIDRLLATEEAKRVLERHLDQEQRDHDAEINKLMDEISKLRAAVEKQQDENKMLLTRLEAVQKKAELSVEKKQSISFLQVLLEQITNTVRKALPNDKKNVAETQRSSPKTP